MKRGSSIDVIMLLNLDGSDTAELTEKASSVVVSVIADVIALFGKKYNFFVVYQEKSNVVSLVRMRRYIDEIMNIKFH